MLYYNYLKNLSNEDMTNELENLVIEKSSKIGHLQHRIEEQSLTIANLQNLLESVVYEKFQITPSDEILKKIDDIYEKIIEITNNEELRLDIAKKGFERSQEFSWSFTADGILDLCQNYQNDENQNFEDEYDKSARRTLSTICLNNNKLKRRFLSSIVQMDFDELIEWSLDKGLDDPDVNDYLIPLTKWLEKNRKEKRLQVSSSD